MSKDQRGSITQSYDWAQALFDMADCDRSDLNSLVQAAHLDPRAGDLSHIDLSELDLQGQDFSGWNLECAILKGARVAHCNFRGAKIAAHVLALAHGWEQAQLDEDLRAKTREVSAIAILEGEAIDFISSIFHAAGKNYRILVDPKNTTFKLPSGTARFNQSPSVMQFFDSIRHSQERPFDEEFISALMPNLRDLQRAIKSSLKHRKFLQRTMAWISKLEAWPESAFTTLHPSESSNSEDVAINATNIKILLDAVFGQDQRMTGVSYLSTANTVRQLGFKTIDQVQRAISNVDDRAISRAANDGTLSGQCFRLEEVLLMRMGEKFINHLYPPGTGYEFMRAITKEKLVRIKDAGYKTGSLIAI